MAHTETEDRDRVEAEPETKGRQTDRQTDREPRSYKSRSLRGLCLGGSWWYVEVVLYRWSYRSRCLKL